MEIKNLNPKIYDEDNNEIIPPEGATGFVAGMEAWQWTFDSGHTAKFIYKPDPYEGPMSENVEYDVKNLHVSTILNDAWKARSYCPYPPKRSYVNGKNFWKYRQRFRNKTLWEKTRELLLSTPIKRLIYHIPPSYGYQSSVYRVRRSNIE